MKEMSICTVVYGFLPDKTFSMIVSPLLYSCMEKYCTSRDILHVVSKLMTHSYAIVFGKGKPLLINESSHECSFQKQLNSFKLWHSYSTTMRTLCFTSGMKIFFTILCQTLLRQEKEFVRLLKEVNQNVHWYEVGIGRNLSNEQLRYTHKFAIFVSNTWWYISQSYVH